MRASIVRLALMMVGLLIAGALAGPAVAQESRIPLAELRSARVNYVSAFNGQAGIVCQIGWASASRYHGTCRELVDVQEPELGTNFVAGRVTEYIYYDGMYYERVNDETTWTSFRDEDYDPRLTLNEIFFGGYLSPPDTGVISNLGTATVDGTATTQYQFWSLDEELNEASGGQYVYDIFVSAQGYVLKDQESLRGSFAASGEGTIENVWSYSSFNADIVVSPPAADAVRPASRSFGARWLPGGFGGR